MENINQTIDDLTFLLLYLTRMNDGGICTSWKNYDFDSLDRLEEGGLVIRRSSKAKSVIIPEESFAKAEELMRKYGIR